MALILDDTLRSTAEMPLANSLVHSYNKRCFQSYEQAEQALINKVLLPGEFVFAYYYDRLSPYGVNALAAVGPLMHGSGNILFKNSITIDNIVEDLNSTIADVNASINYLREDLLDSIDNALLHLDASLNDVLEQFVSAGNTYNISISNLNTQLIEGDTSIMGVVNTSYNILSEKVNNNYNDLSSLIQNVSDGLNTKIDTVNTSLINYITNLFNDGFGDSKEETDDKIQNTSNSLSLLIKDFKDELIEKTNDIDKEYKLAIQNLRYDVSNLQIDVETNRTLYQTVIHSIKHTNLDEAISLNTSVLNTIAVLQDKVNLLTDKVNTLTNKGEESDNTVIEDSETENKTI